jgi:hypothetical protein
MKTGIIRKGEHGACSWVVLGSSGNFDTDRHSIGSMNDGSVLGKEFKRDRGAFCCILMNSKNHSEILRKTNTPSRMGCWGGENAYECARC